MGTTNYQSIGPICGQKQRSLGQFRLNEIIQFFRMVQKVSSEQHFLINRDFFFLLSFCFFQEDKFCGVSQIKKGLGSGCVGGGTYPHQPRSTPSPKAPQSEVLHQLSHKPVLHPKLFSIVQQQKQTTLFDQVQVFMFSVIVNLHQNCQSETDGVLKSVSSCCC